MKMLSIVLALIPFCMLAQSDYELPNVKSYENPGYTSLMTEDGEPIILIKTFKWLWASDPEGNKSPFEEDEFPLAIKDLTGELYTLNADFSWSNTKITQKIAARNGTYLGKFCKTMDVKLTIYGTRAKLENRTACALVARHALSLPNGWFPIAHGPNSVEIPASIYVMAADPPGSPRIAYIAVTYDDDKGLIDFTDSGEILFVKED